MQPAEPVQRMCTVAEDEDITFWDETSYDNELVYEPNKRKRAIRAPVIKPSKKEKINKDEEILRFNFPFQVTTAHDLRPTASTKLVPHTAVDATGKSQHVNSKTSVGFATNTIGCITSQEKQNWLAALTVSESDVDVISAYTQGSAEWLRSRVGRITSSNFGAAMGINPFTNRRQLLKQLLWGGFHGNVATAWGQNHENVARTEYVENIEDEIRQQLAEQTALRATHDAIEEAGDGADSGVLDDDNILVSISIEETGLLITPERPWMGNSPDGIIHHTYKSGRKEKGLLEIKCPFKKQFYTPNPVPVYYYSQIQGTMGNLGLPWCDFVVWTPTGMQITRVLFDQTYWDEDMLPKVSQFYFDMYMPLAIQKQKGILPTNQIELI